MKVYTYKGYKYWYERCWRSWAIVKYDEEGNQLGDAVYVYSKEEVKPEIDSLVEFEQGEMK